MESLIIENKNLKMRFRVAFTEKGGSFGNAIIFNVNNSKYDSVRDKGTRDIELNIFKTLITVDIPVLLPLKSQSRYDIRIDGEVFKVFHKKKARGEENYSTINTEFLPSFSRLEILSQGVGFEPEKKNNHYDSYQVKEIILKIVNKFLYYLNIGENKKIGIQKNIISYEMHYYLIKNSIIYENPEFSIYVFHDGIIEIKGNDSCICIEEHQFLKSELLKEQIGIENFILDNPIREKEFSLNVDKLVNRFLYYCAQHQKSVSRLKEEEIRDLFLVPVKCVFSNGDGEVFNYNGKLDFKITNPENQFEYVSGEFKLWTGEKSFDEIMYQGTEKHCTGYEAKIYLIVISDKKDIHKINLKILDRLSKNTKISYDGTIGLDNISNKESKIFLYQTSYESRLGNIPIAIGICDVFFENK